uniref:Uncharacterized protein n=1 Tax=Takifugu rubripes TaxID=31033 RepID=A0A674MAM6_TAKRU
RRRYGNVTRGWDNTRSQRDRSRSVCVSLELRPAAEQSSVPPTRIGTETTQHQRRDVPSGEAPRLRGHGFNRDKDTAEGFPAGKHACVVRSLRRLTCTRRPV